MARALEEPGKMEWADTHARSTPRKMNVETIKENAAFMHRESPSDPSALLYRVDRLSMNATATAPTMLHTIASTTVTDFPK
ncbi:hypothetical protein N7492_009171 [Penicillium capsulatum]|uniref:Uncharacterized protein n=1 Tax=Penicillium capsulatum TaxID=69766 RepID=A0A9W9HR46_9EURO|nr:hypothetical protein N7492_009171 [Penicillium capsulatum]